MLCTIPTCTKHEVHALLYTSHILNFIMESYQQYSDEKGITKLISILKSSNNSISRLSIILAKVLF